MRHDTIYPGEDLSLRGEVSFDHDDTSSSLEEFDLRVGISTAAAGKKFLFSSITGHGLPVTKQDDTFTVRLSGEQTAMLKPGPLTATISLTHKQTGVRCAAEQRIIELVEPLNPYAI